MKEARPKRRHNVWRSGKGQTTGTEHRLVVAEVWGWEQGVPYTRDMKELCEIMEIFNILIVVMVCYVTVYICQNLQSYITEFCYL